MSTYLTAAGSAAPARTARMRSKVQVAVPSAPVGGSLCRQSWQRQGRAGSMRRHDGILLVLFLWRGRLRRPPRSDGRNATDPSGCEGITGLRTRTSRFDDGKGRCAGSDRRAQPRCSGPFTWPSEMPSTSSATYAPAERCEFSGMPRTMTGCRRRPPCDAYLARSGPAHSR